MFELILIAGAAIAVLALILWGRRPDPRSRVRCHSCGKFVAWGEHIPLAVAAPHIWADYCPDCAAHLLAGRSRVLKLGEK